MKKNSSSQLIHSNFSFEGFRQFMLEHYVFSVLLILVFMLGFWIGSIWIENQILLERM